MNEHMTGACGISEAHSDEDHGRKVPGFPQRKVQYYMQPKVYRGSRGWHIGSRNRNWNISVFIDGPDAYARATAFRNAYKDWEAGRITEAERDAIERKVLLG